jgi:hypothetical protein
METTGAPASDQPALGSKRIIAGFTALFAIMYSLFGENDCFIKNLDLYSSSYYGKISPKATSCVKIIKNQRLAA